MKLIVASDEKTNLTQSTVRYLKEKGHQITLMGDLLKKDGKWAEIGKQAAQKVAKGKADQAVLFCWSGTGNFHGRKQG